MGVKLTTPSGRGGEFREKKNIYLIFFYYFTYLFIMDNFLSVCRCVCTILTMITREHGA